MGNMENDFWSSFFNKLPYVLEIFKANAKRSGISEYSAVLLTIYSEFPDIYIPIKEEIKQELISKDLINVDDDKITVTSKGAILAKSFIQLRKANFK